MTDPHPITRAAQGSSEPHFRPIGLRGWAQEYPRAIRPDIPGLPSYDARYDMQLLNEGDQRNVLDKYRYWTIDAINADLDIHGRNTYRVAIENWTHDFNIGSMVRSANAFGAQEVYIVGPHKWNRKGSLMTEKYQHISHYSSISQLMRAVQQENPQMRIIAIDNIDGAVPIETYQFPQECLMLFGAEGPGLSQEALHSADDVVYITQYGSVRSINAGAAAAIAMHTWVVQHYGKNKEK